MDVIFVVSALKDGHPRLLMHQGSGQRYRVGDVIGGCFMTDSIMIVADPRNQKIPFVVVSSPGEPFLYDDLWGAGWRSFDLTGYVHIKNVKYIHEGLYEEMVAWSREGF